jgi:isopentenyl phosphate kinase
VEAGVEAVIVNAEKEGNVYKALRKERVAGTLIKRE